MQVQVVAVQEVVQHARGRAALLDLMQRLDQHTHGHWQAELDSCPDDGRQHLGFLYDAVRVQMSELRMIDAINPGRHACDKRLRPGMSATFRWEDGFAVRLLTLHLDSGETPRDYANRQLSTSEALRAARGMASRAPTTPTAVLGDWNTMGCADCVPAVAAESEQRKLAELAATPLPTLQHVVPEQRCSEYYHGHGVWLDHVLVYTPRQAQRGARVSTQSLCAQHACGFISHADEQPAFAHLSDHCPVVLEFPANPVVH